MKPIASLFQAKFLLLPLLALLVQLANSRPLKEADERHHHLNLITSQAASDAAAAAAATATAGAETTRLADHMHLISSRQLSTRAPEAAAEADTGSALKPIPIEGLTKRLESLKSAAEGQACCSKFDHRDYVVSDLEFELVLRRLIKLAPQIELISDSGSDHKDDNGEQHASTSGDENFRSSECFICLEEFAASDEAAKAVEAGELPKTVRLLCKHEFHTGCILAWFKANMASSRRCPVCMNLMRHLDGELFAEEPSKEGRSR